MKIQDGGYRTVGYVDGNKIQDSGYRTVGYVDGNKIQDSGYRTIGYVDGYGASSAIAAAALLLFGVLRW